MTQNLAINPEETNPQELLRQFFSAFTQYSEEERQFISSSWEYLCQKTEKVERTCGKPYYLHCMRVACILAESKLDAECIVAGFFHNILELEQIDKNELEEKLGKTIFCIISGTTKITALKIQNKTLQQADSVRKMLFAMADDIRVILVKLADRLDRLRNISFVQEDIQKKIAQEVIDIWAPLANRLGMSSVKCELEDLSLKILNPNVYAHLKKIVSLKKTERARYLEAVEKAVLSSANRSGIEISISSRAKHFYSIYQKMRKRNKGADEIFDLLAMRILCNTPAECYTLIGIVHGLWKPLEGRFKDYIAMPKSNGYQSLHTTVMCNGQPLEIQIRTHEMHAIAEYGVASHWLYKKGTNHDMVSVENLSIINQLKQLRGGQNQDDNFFAEIKDELLGDSIFVFTPKGDVVELPAGSTAIDFAYHIHSAVGEKITGAKADGHIIPLARPLKNTQIIEILTNPKAHPTENQLHIVKTAKAKSKIRSWLQQNATSVSDNTNAKNVSGEMPSENTTRVHRKGKGPKTEVPLATGSEKIKIGDSSNFLVTKAKCCSPVPGDSIIGYVSRGRGIIVHRSDCRVFAHIPNVEVRTLEAEWE